jgi:hypothetical protein
MTIVATKHRTASGGTAIESSDGKSGAVICGDGSAFTWGDDGAVLLADLAADPRDGLHLSDPDYPPSAPNVAAEVAEVREKLYGDGRTPGERASAAEVQKRIDSRKGHTDEDARQADEIRDFLKPRAGQRTPSEAPWSEGNSGSADRSADLDEMLKADPQLARLHGRLSDSQAPLHRPESDAGDKRDRDAADPMVLGAGSGKRTTQAHEQALPLLAPQSIAQLRGYASSDDPEERMKVKRAVSALPALAQALGRDLMRKLRDDR